MPLLIAAAGAAPFWPALNNEFVNWDDDLYLTGHDAYHGLGLEQLRWMFTTTHGGPYQPLGWLSWALDYAIWGMKPRGYHLTNMLLHAANAAVFYLLAVCLLRRAVGPETPRSGAGLRVGAAAAALWFAVHPLRVESVAWATERRDVLSGLFCLLSVWAYLRWVERGAGSTEGRAPGWPGGAFAWFLCALGSKGISVTLPLVLLMLDAYPLRRVGVAVDGRGLRLSGQAGRALLEKIPFLLASLAVGLVALHGVREVGALTARGVALVPRLAISCYSVCFYLLKTVWPVNLSPLYETPLAFELWEWRYLLSAAAFVLLGVVVYRCRARWPGLLVAWVCYLVVLGPVSGLLHAGPQIAADRYTYLAMLSPVLLAGGVVCRVWSAARGPGARAALAGGVLALAAVLGVLSFRQTRLWRNSVTLWQQALRVDPESWNAKHYLGVSMAQLNRTDQAIDLYRQALEANPQCARIHYNLGMALFQQGHPAEAVERFREALRLRPEYPEAHYNLATLLMRRGRLDQAIEHYEAAVRQRSDYTLALNNLGTTLLRAGRIEQAMERYREVLRIDPNNVMAWINVGSARYAQGDTEEAIRAFRQALRINPRSVEAHYALGRALAEQGRVAEGIEEGLRALRINPERADIRQWLDSLSARRSERGAP